MNLAIISTGDNSKIKANDINIPWSLIRINGEYIIERIIRIAKQSGFNKVSCIINESEFELKRFLMKYNFGIQLNLVVKDTPSSMHSLFSLAPFLTGEAFCLITTNSLFDEKEFSDFINYSIIQKDADGTIAVKRCTDDENPLCVAMDEDDTILKFSDSKDGYNWATGEIYYFSPKILDEMEYALEKGICQLRPYLKHIVANNYLLKGYVFT